MRPSSPSSTFVSAAALGALIAIAAFLALLPGVAATDAPQESDLVLRPTHRHGADPLDPYAAWFVSSYTASEPLVPYVTLDEKARGTDLSKEIADPLRRSAEPLVAARGG